ncbi:phage/plasmid primase, P4 family [Candidatus Eisenbacteria bacterium]|uniref:Phage/plasmid primase, P4 family n=1 Tax=Eiseniibacteriota bacterium TaxID=2212470 RepID=A0ABV6YK93_UNCEI
MSELPKLDHPIDEQLTQDDASDGTISFNSFLGTRSAFHEAEARREAVAAEADHPHFTDQGNAQRLVALHGDRFRYCHPMKTDLVWAGTRWKRDDTAQIARFAKDVARSIYREASEETDDKRCKDLVSWGRKCESHQRIEAMIKLARSEPGIPVRQEELDANVWLLNVKNGTLDLRTGELRSHDPNDLITKLAPVEYDPDAQLELWDKFLGRILPDYELRSFVQRAAGYTLTGDAGEEVLFFPYGPAATGKSTFLEAMKATLGDYAATLDFETLLRRRDSGGPRNDIARLAGARMAVSLEVDEGKWLAEGLVKSITGGDKVCARFLYKEAFEFLPSFKLWLGANHRPKVKDDDSALWRRILQISFVVEIPRDERDPKVKATLRDPKQAGSAILNWALQGCLEWQKLGNLAVPKAVWDATSEYRVEMDPIRAWLDECCEIDVNALTLSSELWESYRTYERGRGVGRTQFQNRLKHHGFVPGEKIEGRRAWQGLRLIPDASDASEGFSVNLP